RNNPAQDARISIRGFGARSAFGVRGIRILRDGVPLTLPDGQTPVDYLDLENVGRVDVLRGSASSLYGNAGGGVIDIRSRVPGAESPGALTLAQWQSDPEMADPLAVRKQAGKRVNQAQFGTSMLHSLEGGGELRATIHAGQRHLYNPLTFGIVQVRRHTSGAE